MLSAVVGGREVSRTVVLEALENRPSLIVDCANACDPYRYLDVVEPEAFDDTYVIGFDLLYSLLDALQQLPGHLDKLKVERVYVTSTQTLFHYRNEEENASVRAHAWKLMRSLAKRYEVVVAVRKGSDDERLAALYASEVRMGHTVSSQRNVIAEMKDTLSRYRRALRREDQEIFDRLTSTPFRYAAGMANASSIHTWALYLLSIMIEQEKELEKLRKR